MNKGLPIIVFLFVSAFVSSPLLVSAVYAVEDSWTTLEPMPTVRSWLGVAVVDDKIYGIGGISGTTRLNVNEMYDPTTNTWTTKASMPTPRSIFGIAVVDDKIYVIGGEKDDYTYTNVNEVYDPATDTWETKKSMPTIRYAMSANVVNGKIYVMGGAQRTPNDDFDVNEVYDPTTDTWTTKTPIPTGVDYYASGVVNNKIYIIGGAVGVTLTQIYDPETDTWSSGTPLLTGVDSAAVGVTAGTTDTQRIFVIGGKQNLDAVTLNQVYDPQTDTWVYGPTMPTARYGLGVAVVDGCLYAIGGREGWVGFPVSAANERYTPADFIPEFHSWILMPLFITMTLVAIAVRNWRLSKKQNQQAG
ncbi:MAG: Kelch repeat-containing protein [archaeon]